MIRWHAPIAVEAAMNRSDKFLLGIVLGIVALVAVGFAVLLTRPKPGYQSEDTPGGVVNNYLLALQQQNYERAYGYLSPSLAGYPRNASTFAQRVSLATGYGSSISLEVTRVSQQGDRATVTVVETAFSQGGLFDSNSYESTRTMSLERDQERWWITHSDSYTFWNWCLEQAGGC
jgi:hypothetical protein